MQKTKLRFLSVVLMVLLIVGMALPSPAVAVPTKQDRMKQQVAQIYEQAKDYYGWDSFRGYCGALVNVQLYLLGITKYVIGVHGRDAYDSFKYLKETSGGYGVQVYPAGQYTLKSALNAITKNGTENAYNILVGFEKTNSEMGSIYGHAVVIQGIVDGMVYYVESYNLSIGGIYYPEGTPVKASINDFVAHYAITTSQFDGVIHFGLKSYFDSCTVYSSNATATVASDAQLWSQPCDDSVHLESRYLGQLTQGQQVQITGLYRNSEGEYWYELDNGKTGFVLAKKLDNVELHFDDVILTNGTAPTALVQGNAFNVKGSITSQTNALQSIWAGVYRNEDDQLVQVIETSDAVGGKRYDLKGSKISSGLTFRNLSAGSYRYELAAVVDNHYFADGKLETERRTITLWTSEFLVTEEKTTVHSVSFNACGGTVDLDQTVVIAGTNVGSLTVAQREGYIFLGWFTAQEGGQRITDDYVPNSGISLYAHWVSQEQLRNEWLVGGNCWYLHSDGISTMICMELDGTLYYFSSLEPMCQNWMIWTDASVT